MGPNYEEYKGRIKQALGSLTDNRKLKSSGKADAASGKAKHMVQDAANTVKSAVDSVKDKLTGK